MGTLGPMTPAGDSFFATAEASGSISVKLYPTEGVSTGVSTLVTFGMPFPRGSITEAGLSTVRVVDGGSEIAAYVAQQTPWRHVSDAGIDGQSVRVATVQIHHTFAAGYPSYETVTVSWGGAARATTPSFETVRNAWHLVTTGTFASGDGVYEPDVYAVLPKAHLCKGVLTGIQYDPFGDGISLTREDPQAVRDDFPWTGWTGLQRCSIGGFYASINEDDARVTTYGDGRLCSYRSTYAYAVEGEPYLYDRPTSFFLLYVATGHFRALREAVRCTEWYRLNIWPSGTSPSAAIGAFKPKNPVSGDYIGSNGAMYSHAECFSYQHWLTGDPSALTAASWIVNCLEESSDEDIRWSAGAGSWNERHMGLRLTSYVAAYDLLGEGTYKSGGPTYKSLLTTACSDLIWHQNGGGGAIPARLDGACYHTGEQHASDWDTGVWGASPWMTAIIMGAMTRAFASGVATSDFVVRAASWLSQVMDYVNGNSLGWDPNYADTSVPLPPYVVYIDGSFEPADVYSDFDHLCDVGTAMSLGYSFDSSKAGIKTVSLEMHEHFQYVLMHWLRPAGPASGLTAYRVNPWRKYGWERRNAFSWSRNLG